MARLVLMCATLLIAGCAAPAADSGLHARDTVAVADGAYVYHGFSADTQVQFSADFSAGTPVDAYVMTNANFDAFQAGNQFVYVCSMEAADIGSLRCPLSAGNYWFVIDNSGRGQAQAGSNTVVTYEFDVQVFTS